MTDNNLDTAESSHRILRLATTAQRPAFRALLDLPDDWPIAEVTKVTIDTSAGTMAVHPGGHLTAGSALRQIISGDLDPEEVLELLAAQHAARPPDREQKP